MLNQEVLLKARRALLERACSVRQAKFDDPIEHQFTANQIRSGEAGEAVGLWLKNALGNCIKHPVLYTISTCDTETFETIRARFDELLKEPQREYRLPQLNRNVIQKTTLYVGGSEGVRRRLKEHIGKAASGTYALNFQRWCPEFDGTITVMVQPFSPDAGRDCRQDLEDALWETLRPIFGKKGAR